MIGSYSCSASPGEYLDRLTLHNKYFDDAVEQAISELQERQGEGIAEALRLAIEGFDTGSRSPAACQSSKAAGQGTPHDCRN
jgi:hypothetical protein